MTTDALVSFESTARGWGLWIAAREIGDDEGMVWYTVKTSPTGVGIKLSLEEDAPEIQGWWKARLALDCLGFGLNEDGAVVARSGQSWGL